jgi:hypothetical protein
MPASEPTEQSTAGSKAPSEPGTFRYTVDPSVVPAVASIEGPDGPRPVAAAADDEGTVTSFVANEIIVATEERSIVDDILGQHGGTIISETRLSDYGIDGPTTYIIRVDVATADLAGFGADMESIGSGGEITFSDNEAAGLVAIAAAGAAAGLPVGINVVGAGVSIPDSTAEAPNDDGDPRDAYRWNTLRRGTVIDIGVPEAWSLLHHVGRLDNRVAIAILDSGFDPDEDFAPWDSWSAWATDAIGTENSGSCGDHECPWHGTGVASVALAVPDNNYGSAGTGGPVGDPIFIRTTYDWGTAVRAAAHAYSMGARIINMSFGADVNWILAPLVWPVEPTFVALRDLGAVFIAAAGNDGLNVDTRRAIGNKEKTYHFPCEGPGIICVGGLEGPNSEYAHSNSNYRGTGDVGGTVDIYAPFCNVAGPDPEHPGNVIWTVCGTSSASPYVAGVAALVLAADPSLSSQEVWEILRDTANLSETGGTRRVNAHGAVLEAIGTFLIVEIIEPTDGSSSNRTSVGLVANLTVISPPGETLPVDIVWRSSEDGQLQARTVDVTLGDDDGIHVERLSFTYTPSQQEHTFTFTATAGDQSASDSISYGFLNDPPDVTVEALGTGEVCFGETVTFDGTAFDPQQPTGAYLDFEWSSNLDGVLSTFSAGNSSDFSTSNLSVGKHKITLEVTDTAGSVGRESVALRVLAPTDPKCSNLAPSAVILKPSRDTTVLTEGVDSIGPYVDLFVLAEVSDAEDSLADLRIEWRSAVESSAVLATGIEAKIRLHITDGSCSQIHHLELIVIDTEGNTTATPVVRTIHVDRLC